MAIQLHQLAHGQWPSPTPEVWGELIQCWFCNWFKSCCKECHFCIHTDVAQDASPLAKDCIFGPSRLHALLQYQLRVPCQQTCLNTFEWGHISHVVCCLYDHSLRFFYKGVSPDIGGSVVHALGLTLKAVPGWPNDLVLYSKAIQPTATQSVLHVLAQQTTSYAWCEDKTRLFPDPPCNAW